MGKLKTKYPVDVSIQFFLFLENSQFLRQTYGVRIDSGHLLYSHVSAKFEEFLINNEIKYEAYMFFQPLNIEEQHLMHNDWMLNIGEVQERGRYIMIRVKSHTQHIKELIYDELANLTNRVEQLEDKVTLMPSKEDTEIKILAPTPMLHHSSSFVPQLPVKDLDIGILFSQPIFDEKKHKEANLPVDFRSQIQRLYSSLNNSYKPEITVECQIGTKQHLKHLIGLKKPKILHIICHGSKEGELEFQDDSKFAIGSLCTIDTAKIREILMSEKESMAKLQLVFINSCHSEIIGKVFFEAGAKYVIMIDSQDKIDDEAAQIFSENFYRNIFRGQKVGFSFKEAKDTVGMKHNSFGCCCRHTSKETHKVGCRWETIKKEIGEQEAHRMYHIPSEKCNCEMRNHNRHKLTCQWAQFSLFHINKDFRIREATGEEHFPKKKSELPAYLPYQKRELVVCCCFNFQGISKEPQIPHSECNKFKMLPVDEDNTQPLYQLQKNVYFRTQIIDYSAPELTEYHEKVQNSSVMGRQQELYEFMKKIKQQNLYLFFLYGHPGVGKTSFAIKTATYLIQRRVYEIYFFIDLYDIRDKDMFRNKFNEVTKFGYPNNRNSLNQIRGKQMLIIFDNTDQFFIQSIKDFQDEIESLKKEFIHTKFIITCKIGNISSLQTEPILNNNGCYAKELKVLDQNIAARALFSKIRNYLDISIEYMDIRGLIANKKELQIPKVIQNLSHSFSNLKNKIKLVDLKNKIEQLGQGDFAFNKLVEQNLNILKAKCKQSYQMLIFISQFSQGIDKNDFNILSMYDKSQGLKEGKSYVKDRYDTAIIDIPIDKNWKKRLSILFQRSKQQQISEITKDSEVEEIDSQTLSFQRHQTSFQLQKSQKDIKQIDDQQMFKGQSYFLQQVSRNRFVVKRFIRDFIWNRDRSDQNYYMKHIFVAYTAVLLDIYLKFLVQEKYIHEEILEYSDISLCGVFKYKDNNYVQFSLTESIRYVEQYNSKFEKILKQQPTLKEKIKSSDPSIFILNHKLDFLHIYGFDWSRVIESLKKNRVREFSILINYLQKLIILIPTALKIANAEDSLIQYSIRQSIQLLAQIREFSKPAHNLLLTLKLKLMKSGSELEKNSDDDSIMPNTEFQRDFHKNDLEKISSVVLATVNTQFCYEVELLQIYKEYLRSKELKKAAEVSIKAGADRLLETIKKLENWINMEQDWLANQSCEILHAKRSLVLSMIYFKVLEVSPKYITNLNIFNFKTKHTQTFCRYASSAAKTFLNNSLMKLALRAKLIDLSINWQFCKLRVKQNEFSKEVETFRQNLREIQEIYEDKKNNLIGLTYFDIHIKKIKKEMKEKLWQESVNSLIFMKAVPLCNKHNAIIENIVRKQTTYRRDLENIFTNAEIDLSIKFEILTSQKLEEESKKGSTILLLNTNTKVESSSVPSKSRHLDPDPKVHLILQGNDLRQNCVQIDKDFIKKYPLNNTKLLIIMGNNANQAIKKIIPLISNSTKNIPSMISITSVATGDFDQFQECSYEEIASHGSNELKTIIQHSNQVSIYEVEIAKNLIKGLLSPKNYQRNIKEIYMEMRSQFTDQLKQIKVDFYENNQEIIRIIKGSFKDLSPGFRKSHNIDFQLKNSTFAVFRKWKEVNEVFKELTSAKTQKYIHICGGNGVGKTTFLQEIGRMCVERGLYQNGVYIMQGKEIQEKHQSDFQAYIYKKSQTGTIFNLQTFNKYANENFLLLIDDFHLIRPRSNGRYNIFLNRLLEKKVNLILTTHESFNIKQVFQTVLFKSVKIDKLNEIELNIYAYNIFDLSNKNVVNEYQEQKKIKKMTLSDIARLSEKHRLQRSPSLLPLRNDEPLKKILSNRN